MDRIFAVIQTLMALIIVIFMAHISLKLMNKYMSKQNKIIKIIERVGVNNNSALSVVEVCGRYYLMSFTQNDNKLIKELDENEVKDLIAEMENKKDKIDSRLIGGFKNLSKKYKNPLDDYWNEGKN